MLLRTHPLADRPAALGRHAPWSWPASWWAVARPHRPAGTRRDAERLQDYDLAVVEYTKALKLKPNDIGVRLGLDRAKLRASEEHFQRGRRLAADGKLEEALVEYQLASELNPTSGVIDEELRSTRNQLRTKIAVAREGKTQLQTLIERTRDLPPPGLDLPSNVKMPTSVMFRDASSRDVFLYIAKFADISLSFDPTFRESPVTIDLRNASLEDALNAVSGTTRTFFRVTAPRTDHRHSRHAGQTPRVRGRSRADVLPEQRRSQGSDGSAAAGRRPAPHRADHRDQRADDQGHSRTDRRRGPRAVGDRQGAARGHHRRRAARSRSDEAARVRAADRIAWLPGHQRRRRSAIRAPAAR